jgi:hypothetical protein
MRNIATTRILYAPENTAPVGPAKPWIWPLPRLDGVSPSIGVEEAHQRAESVAELAARQERAQTGTP